MAADNPVPPEMKWQWEVPNTFWPSNATDKSTVFGSFLFPSERTHFLLTTIEGMTDPRVSDTEVVARMMEVVLRDPDSELDRVPQVVSSIHKKLRGISEASLQAILNRTLFQMACLDPDQVVEGLLNTSLLCDGVAGAMWRTLVCEHCPAEEVLKELLFWLWDQPLLRRASFMPNDSYILPLTAIRALNEILRLPSSKVPVQLIFPQLYLAVLFQIFFSMEYTLQDLQDYSQMCGQEDECPPVSPVRSAVQAMKALLCRADYAHLADSVERQGGWDMLMSMETYHTGVTLLTRELWMNAADECAWVFDHVVAVLSCRDKQREIAAMAVFTELLNCTDFEQEIDEDVLGFLQLHLCNQSLAMREMVIAGLVTLSERRQTARSLQDLLPALMERLQGADSNFCTKALTILSHVLHLVDRKRASAIGLQLAEELRPLFDDEAARVRELSIQLFQHVMAIVVGSQQEQMRKHVHSSLLPLLIHAHEEIPSVAQASREALLSAAKLLKWEQLRHLLETAQTWQIGECLLVRDRSRAEEYLRQSLPYLESPQECLREVAVRFLGLVGRHMSEQGEEKLQDICKALQSVVSDTSPYVWSLAVQTILILRAPREKAPSGFTLRTLCYRLRRAWRRWHPPPRDSAL
ncbi:maestro heat-like repeat-containing protein family member 7 [Apteryx mantelli]|uniref:Maestro heat-like repeat-containing protein family member 7 n=1 Tax=Apteryx mantelli TaxID=2696672 RepID=A0ABM4G8P9_9AVES